MSAKLSQFTCVMRPPLSVTKHHTCCDFNKLSRAAEPALLACRTVRSIVLSADYCLQYSKIFKKHMAQGESAHKLTAPSAVRVWCGIAVAGYCYTTGASAKVHINSAAPKCANFDDDANTARPAVGFPKHKCMDT